MTVILRSAVDDDVLQIVSMVNRFADQNIMLPRTEEGVRQSIADWFVAAHDGTPPPGEPVVVACGALMALTDSLAEVRSLAVHESQQGEGLGGEIVLALVQEAREHGYAQVCALTLRENFFVRLGFSLVDRWSISPKVWQACIYCRKFHRCDEVAVLMNLREVHAVAEPESANVGWSNLLKWDEWQPLRLAYRTRSTDDEPEMMRS